MPAHHHRSWPTTTGRAVAEVGLPDPGLRASGDHPARARGPHGGPASRLGRSLRTRAALPEPTGAGRLPANDGTDLRTVDVKGSVGVATTDPAWPRPRRLLLQPLNGSHRAHRANALTSALQTSSYCLVTREADRIPGEHQWHLPPDPARPRAPRRRRRGGP